MPYLESFYWLKTSIRRRDNLNRFTYIVKITIKKKKNNNNKNNNDTNLRSLYHRRHAAGLCMLTIKVNSHSNHCLLCELLSTSYRFWHTRAASAANPMEFEVSRCRTSQFASVSCRPRLVHGMTFPTLCTAPERWMGLREQSTVQLLSCFVFFSFPCRRCLWICEINL